MEVLIVTFFGCGSDTADVLTAGRNNVKLVETRTVHFARLK